MPTTSSASAPADWDAVRAALQKSLKPAFILHESGDHRVFLYGGFEESKPAPVDYDLKLIIRAGGREWELARMKAAKGDVERQYFLPGNPEYVTLLMLDTEQLTGFLEQWRTGDPRIDVILRPLEANGQDLVFPRVGLVCWTY